MEKNDIIEKFLNKQLLNVPSTRKNYRINIQSYFKHISKDMETYFPFEIITEDEKGKKLKEPKIIFTTPLDDYDNDLRAVYTILEKRGKGDLSKRTFFNSVKQFMVSNNKQLKDLEFWDILKARTRNAEPESDVAKLNAEDIKTILSHGNACSRALFLMLASSGRRISEILALTPDDINTNVTPTTINIKKTLGRRTTKTKQKTLCFISNEATEAYKAWLKERPLYLEDAIKRAAGKNKDPKDPRCFPMTYSNAIAIWSTLLMKSNVVEIEYVEATKKRNGYRKIKREHKGDRVLAHPHCLRAFFRSYFGDADLAEFIMGHSTLLTRAYKQMKPEDLSAKYSKFMPNVTIFETTSKDIDDLNVRMKQKDKDIEEMKAQITELRLALMEEKVNNGTKKK